MAHTWPKPVKPIAKSNRTCTTCGLTASATKYKQTDPGEYHWGVAWGRGGEHGIVEGLRALPACLPAVSRAGLEVLRATGRGEVSRESGLHAVDFSWRDHPAGPSLTSSVEALERLGLVEEGAPYLLAGQQRTPLQLTGTGRLLAPAATPAFKN